MLGSVASARACTQPERVAARRALLDPPPVLPPPTQVPLAHELSPRGVGADRGREGGGQARPTPAAQRPARRARCPAAHRPSPTRHLQDSVCGRPEGRAAGDRPRQAAARGLQQRTADRLVRGRMGHGAARALPAAAAAASAGRPSSGDLMSGRQRVAAAQALSCPPLQVSRAWGDAAPLLPVPSQRRRWCARGPRLAASWPRRAACRAACCPPFVTMACCHSAACCSSHTLPPPQSPSPSPP